MWGSGRINEVQLRVKVHPHGQPIMVQLGSVLMRTVRKWRVKNLSPAEIQRGEESVRDLLPYTVVNPR